MSYRVARRLNGWRITSVPSRESAMASTMVRYKVRPDRVDENVALVRAVYAQLAEERTDGVRYATFRLPDGVSFMHIVIESDAGPILNGLSAFRAFQEGIEERCDEPPSPTALTIVGSHGII